MIEILEPGWAMSFQDAGRFGSQRYGVPVSGPMDWFAHHCANLLAGNPAGAPCIEVGLSSAHIHVLADSLLVFTGAGYQLRINESIYPMWMAIWCRSGDLVTLEKIEGGNWAYLAVAGGWQAPGMLGSTCTYLPASLGASIEVGSLIIPAIYQGNFSIRAGRSLPATFRPPYSREVHIRVTSGLHEKRFTGASLSRFWQTPYRVTAKSDRMGYRLAGEALQHTLGADIISQGMVLGTIQVPGDGQPMVMMADHPTTGGYTQLAIVTRADLPLLSQCEPEISTVTFELISVEDAQRVYRESLQQIAEGIESTTDEWTRL